MICSGLCRLRRFVVESLLARIGLLDSHNTWIRFWGALHLTCLVISHEVATIPGC